MTVKIANESLSHSYDSPTLVNTLSSNILSVYDPVKKQTFKINFSRSLLTPEMSFWVKECFVAMCGGWNHPETQTLSARIGTAKTHKIALIRIGVWASINYPNLPMSRWTEVQVKELLLAALNDEIPFYGEDEVIGEKPVGRGGIESVHLVLKRSRKLKLTGKVADGIGFDFPKNFMQKCIEDDLKNYGMTYHNFIQGGGWHSVPLPIAMSLLHEAIEVIKAPKTQFLLEYFKFQRSDLKYSFAQIEQGYVNKFMKGEMFKNKTKFTGKAAKQLKQMQTISSLIKKHFDDEINVFPFNGAGELSDYCVEVYEACLVIFLTLTGIRISELSSVFADDYDIARDGVWEFKSDLIKTNSGITEVRVMHGLVAQAADVLVNLSYVDKRERNDKERLPLFGRYFRKPDFNNNVNFRRTGRGISHVTLSSGLNRFYSKFLEVHPEFAEECSSVHPHRFRHTWAEFALRRFEGNVFESIRRHFRHSYGSYYTTHYVFGKLSDEVRDQIEQEFLQEILTKIATENVQAMLSDEFKKDLVGRVANYVSRAMDTSILSESEVSDFIEELSHDFESIVAHEYGYCLVRKDTKALANCTDKETQTPIIENGCFELCSGCPHFLSSINSNADSITRIAVSHENMIARFTELFGSNVTSKAIEASKKTITNAEKLLDEMGLDHE